MKPQVNSNATKEIILREAKRLLKENGTLTIKDITQAAYVNVAAVNYHFGTKENLIKTVITETLNDLRMQIIEKMINPEFLRLDLDNQLTAMVDLLFRYFKENSGIIIYSLVEGAKTDNDLAKPIIDMFIFDPTFSNTAIDHICNITKNPDRNVALAKYILIFSSLVTPLFMESAIDDKYCQENTDLSREQVINQMNIYYLNEIKQILLPRNCD